MKVRSTSLGYYEHKLRPKGEEFNLTDPKHFSKKWMEKVDAPVEAVAVEETDAPPAARRGRPRNE